MTGQEHEETEENTKPEYCPFCASDEIEYAGKTGSGGHIIHCTDCGADSLIRDVTGKFKITITIKGEDQPRST